jgi:hypothetical protein
VEGRASALPSALLQKGETLSQYVVVVASAHVGGKYIVKNEVWHAGDPFVKAHPTWFSSDLGSIAKGSAPVVESATAAPGEKRTVRAK